MQIACPVVTGWPGAIARSATTPARWRGDLVLHLHRLDDADHLAELDEIAVGNPHLQHRALHRARNVVGAARACAGRRPLPPAPGERAVRRLGHVHLHLDAAAVDLRERHTLDGLPRGRRGAPHGLGRELLGAQREQLGLDEPEAGLAGLEARVREERLVEADQRLHAADLELAERAEHAPDRVLAVGAANDQLGDHRVVERRDLRPGGDAGVDTDSGPRRLAVHRDPARATAGSRSRRPRR